MTSFIGHTLKITCTLLYGLQCPTDAHELAPSCQVDPVSHTQSVWMPRKQPSYMAVSLGYSVVSTFIHSNMNTPNWTCMLMTSDKRQLIQTWNKCHDGVVLVAATRSHGNRTVRNIRPNMLLWLLQLVDSDCLRFIVKLQNKVQQQRQPGCWGLG